MLAEERAVSDAERALDLPLERFLDYLVRLESRWDKRRKAHST